MNSPIDNTIIEDYKFRINRVIDYIESNISNEFTLEELSKIANFSKFHFHRIFYSMVGETLFQFIQRLRLERAATCLIISPGKTITDIAYDCGFTSSAAFARSFKDFFKQSATEYRKSNLCKTESNLEQENSNLWKEKKDVSLYIEYINGRPIWKSKTDKRILQVEIKDCTDITLAYVRHIGPYKTDYKLFQRLCDKLYRWAGSRNLILPETKFIVIYHDNPDITPENKLRVSACIPIPSDIEVSGEIGKLILEGGKYAFIRFEIGINEFQFAWSWVYGTWLPESGFLPDDRLCYELYHSDRNTSPDDKFLFDICVPVFPR